MTAELAGRGYLRLGRLLAHLGRGGNPVAVALIIVAIVLLGVAVYVSRRRR